MEAKEKYKLTESMRWLKTVCMRSSISAAAPIVDRHRQLSEDLSGDSNTVRKTTNIPMLHYGLTQFLGSCCYATSRHKNNCTSSNWKLGKCVRQGGVMVLGWRGGEEVGGGGGGEG